MASAEREPIMGVWGRAPSKPKIVLGMDRICEFLALESFSDYCK